MLKGWFGNLLGAIFIFAIFAYGLFDGYQSWQLYSEGERITGVVVDFITTTGEDNIDAYKPVVQYLVDGQTFSFQGSTATRPPAYNIGEEVEILYAIEQPEKARIYSFSDMWLMPAILIPLGGILSVGVIIETGADFWRKLRGKGETVV